MAKAPQPSGSNKAPTSISLAGSTIAENTSGATIGVLTGTDPNKGDKLTFSVVDPNSPFVAVQENGVWVLKLKPGTSLDYEAGTPVTVQVRVIDSGGLSLTQNLNVDVTDVNEAPDGITLSNAGIEENSLPGTVVGYLTGNDPEGYALTFNVVDPNSPFIAAEENGSWVLKLRPGASLDYEAASTLPVQVKATDTGGLSVIRTLTISVANVNEAPQNVTLSNASVSENATGSVIGRLGATDPEASNLTFTVVDSTSPFVAVHENGGWLLKLKPGSTLNYEAGPALSVQVRAIDSGGLSATRTFTISVGDVNEAPQDIAIVGGGVDENAPAGTVIGHVSATDPDVGDVFTFALVNGADGSDNELVEIFGNEIRVRSGAAIDFETDPVLNLYIRVTDSGGLSYTKALQVAVRDLLDGPLIIATADPVVNGTEFDDQITGISTSTRQILKGYGGNDALLLPDEFGGIAYGDEGSDVLYGGNASAGFIFNELEGGAGDDVLVGGSLAAGSATGWGQVENILRAGTGSDVLVGGDYAGAAEEGNVENYFVFDDLNLGDQADGGSGARNLLEAFGSAGTDTLTVGSSGWSLNGESLNIFNMQTLVYAAGGGSDLVDMQDSGLEYVDIQGGDGNDNLTGADNNVPPAEEPIGTKHPYSDQIITRLLGGTGADLLTGGSAHGGHVNNNIWGDEDNDILVGGGSTHGNVLNWLDGGEGDDVLYGGTTIGGTIDDTLLGSAGKDTLISGSGSGYRAFMLGGVGADRFVFSPGSGTIEISDFAKGEDLVDLRGYALDGIEDLTINDVDSSHSVIALGDQTITFHGVTGLSAGDFLFS